MAEHHCRNCCTHRSRHESPRSYKMHRRYNGHVNLGGGRIQCGEVHSSNNKPGSQRNGLYCKKSNNFLADRHLLVPAQGPEGPDAAEEVKVSQLTSLAGEGD